MSSQKTEVTAPPTPGLDVPRFRVQVVAGVDQGARADARGGRLTVGSAPDVTLTLNDPTVSRYHLELAAVRDGIAVRDLGSTNGTWLASALVREVVVRGEVELLAGRTRLRLSIERERDPVELSAASSFGRLMGSSPAMRAVYTALERAAPTTSPVLVTGESGTGKELAARAVHEASARRDKAFEVVDCGGLPPSLIEAELFGHERGAFTGAVGDRPGAFERADGGTLFLDELGEMPLEVQPKLLRALGEREVRRVGGSKVRKVDVRVVAATNRDLRREVNAGRFRADLFYRLAVIQVPMPPLRERLEDLGVLVPSLVEALRSERGIDPSVALDPEVWPQLTQHSWPGNVRELRNYLEQCLVLRVMPALGGESEGESDRPSMVSDPAITALPLKVAKEQFERQYVEALLEQTGGNISEAARRAGVDRVTLFRTMRRYGIKREE